MNFSTMIIKPSKQKALSQAIGKYSRLFIVEALKMQLYEWFALSDCSKIAWLIQQNKALPDNKTSLNSSIDAATQVRMQYSNIRSAL